MTGPMPGGMVEVATVREAVAGMARVTPLLEAPGLSESLGRTVLVKYENLQVTGSFKVRGAAARLSALGPDERARGVVACSSGNHGRAVAYVAGRMGIPATVCVPEWVDPVKLAGIRAAGAEAVLAGPTYDEAEAYAARLTEASGRTFISAFDDPWVIAGQGTLALEVLDALGRPPCAILAPLSGGGLMAGIALGLRARLGPGAPATVAVTARRAGVMLASLEAGHPVELPEEETVAGALAGGIGLANRWSFPLVRELVTEHVVVAEAAIRQAMTYAIAELKTVAEGGGATALAAVLSGAWRPPADADGPVVVVVSGGNVDMPTLMGVLADADP